MFKYNTSNIAHFYSDFLTRKSAHLQSNSLFPTKRKVQLSSTPQKGYFVGTPFCTLVGLYFIFILAYVISSLSRNLKLCLYKNWL